MLRKSFTYNGKRHSVRAKTEKELIEKVALKKRDLDNGVIVTSKMNCNAWFQEWLTSYKQNTVSERTFKDYEYMIKLIDLDMPINLVKPINLQNILNKHKGQSLSHVKKIRMTMKQAFQCAMDNELIRANPASKLSLPSTYDNQRRMLTDKERTNILEVCKTHHAGNWIRIMLYCGCRPGETELLQGKDIDLKSNILHIRGTKTKAADRFVPIPNWLALEFKNKSPFEYLFTTKFGTQLNQQSRQRWWESFKRDLNIKLGCRTFRNQLVPPFPVAEDLVPYIFRHTYCTDLLLAGVDLYVVQEFMGHTDIAVTAIYTHFTKTALEDAQNKIVKFYDKKEENNDSAPLPAPHVL